MVPSILTDRKKINYIKLSNVVEEASVAEGQKEREQVVFQETLGVKTWLGVPEVELAQLRWREPEAQQVAVNLAPSAECRQGLLVLPLASSRCG